MRRCDAAHVTQTSYVQASHQYLENKQTMRYKKKEISEDLGRKRKEKQNNLATSRPSERLHISHRQPPLYRSVRPAAEAKGIE